MSGFIERFVALCTNMQLFSSVSQNVDGQFAGKRKDSSHMLQVCLLYILKIRTFLLDLLTLTLARKVCSNLDILCPLSLSDALLEPFLISSAVSCICV